MNGGQEMKRTTAILFTACIMVIAMVSVSMADHIDDYKNIAEETVQAIIKGSVSNVDRLISNQEKLMEIAIEECQEHKEESSKDAKLMSLVIENVSRMKGSTLEDIENDWHYGELPKANGIDFDSLDPLGPATILMHMAVHPASAYVALRDYKTSKDSDMLDLVKDELSEVLKHMEHVEEHMKEHGHQD